VSSFVELQWSRFFSKRKISLLPALPDHPYLASMEPLFFKAENARNWKSYVGNVTASMEPLFFKAENSEENQAEEETEEA